ncbi:MAG: ATP-binding cassette domain-containing protein [Myxococcota bacterium]
MELWYNQPMHIELKGVTKTFGNGSRMHHAVQQVSFEARSGEVLGILGPNGAGKTTMIRMLLDILRPDEGQILVDGQAEANRAPEFKANTGYLPEERGLYQRRKVSDVLWYLGAIKGLTRDEALARGERLLARLGLEGWQTKRINELSKGMGQKVQIACSLLHDPDLVVLDEPFSGLDPVNVRLVRRLVADLRSEGKVILLSTHLMAEVEALCDRIVMIHQGQKVLEGEVDAVKRTHTPWDVMVDPDTPLHDLVAVAEAKSGEAVTWLRLSPGHSITTLMAELGQKGRPVRMLREATTPLEDIFVGLVGEAPVEVPLMEAAK